MARYIGPKCKLARREGTDLFLKSARRALDSKCKLDTPPGQHRGKNVRLSGYGVQLREKQKIRRIYGVLERQFRKYFAEAVSRKGSTGENLLQLLESRLDNVVYRLGLGGSRAQARQLVRHGHFTVNGRKCNIPSALVEPGDMVAVAERARNLEIIRAAAESTGQRQIPVWLAFDAAALSARVNALPTRNEIDTQASEQLIVEFYAR